MDPADAQVQPQPTPGATGPAALARERGRRHSEAIERLADPYFALGPDARLIEANDALCALLQRARASLVGTSLFSLLGRDGAARLAQALATASDGARYWSLLLDLVLPDGGTVPVQMRALNRRGDHGELESAHGFITDLSEIVGAQRAVAESERELRGILDHLQDTYYRLDAAGRFVRLSRSAERLLGFGPDELAGRRLADLWLRPRELPRILARLRAGGGRLSNLEGRLRHRGGREVVVSVTARLLVDDAGAIVGIEGTARDVTDLRRARERLALAARVFDAAGEAILIVSPAWRVVAANPAFTARTGWGAEAALGRPVSDFVGAVDESGDHELERRLTVALDEGAWSGEVRCRRRDGRALAAWLTATRVPAGGDSRGQTVMLLSDLGERTATQERLAFLAHHDPLTELPNRVLFRERFERTIARAARSGTVTALLFVDLDDFKHVNDSLGHAAGDQVLREVARRLCTRLRATDAVGRHGGDEFVVALADLPDTAAAEAAAAAIRERLAAPIVLGKAEVRVTCTIGVAVHPDHGDDYDALVRMADLAMYAGKRAGRDRVFTATATADPATAHRRGAARRAGPARRSTAR